MDSSDATGVSRQQKDQAKKANVPNNRDAVSNNRDTAAKTRDTVPNIDAVPTTGSNSDAVPRSSTFIGTRGKLQSQSFATSTTQHRPPLLRNSSWKY